MNKPILQVVPIIDTEGPKVWIGDTYDNWGALGNAMKVFTAETRKLFKDSFNGVAKYSWFILDWTGYSLDDSEFRRRGHDNRLHAVWNFYREGILADAELNRTGDGIYWHYHHPPKDGSWGWNNDWHDSAWHEYIIAKRMLDFGFFPSIYRAGKYVENNKNSHWLEKWIPVDFSSISPIKQEFCDWSRAPVDWQPYHPNFDDYQRPGEMKRIIARSLPVAAKGGSGDLQESEVEKAFNEAKEKGSAIFSFHTHDFYKSIFDDFATACGMIERVSRSFGVSWKFSNALDAARKYLEPVSGDFSLRLERTGNDVDIFANHDIFGEMPFVAVEYANGEVLRVDAEEKNGGWIFALPKNVRRFAVGAADGYGNTDVKSIIL
ncbi:MAG: hypothetical protein Q7S66_05465 [bacterium]|nr:hypothetical protein [bacterium]